MPPRSLLSQWVHETLRPRLISTTLDTGSTPRWPAPHKVEDYETLTPLSYPLKKTLPPYSIKGQFPQCTPRHGHARGYPALKPMPCYSPLTAFKSRHRGANGKHTIGFSSGGDVSPLQLACGQCIGCRIDRSRQWAARCLHESTLHSENSFLTLTYNDDNLPADRSVRVNELQKFMKALRRKIKPKPVRFFSCGEYGEQHQRPHYHIALFGHDFDDKELFFTKSGNKLYLSKTLEKIWGKGFCSIGELNYQSAAYIARYVIKKINGDKADEHYEYIDESTGEVIQRKPEFINMSRKPGIGQGWFETYSDDVFPSDFLVINGKEHKVPKYYDKQFEMLDPEQFELIKLERLKRAMKDEANNTAERLNTRKKVAELRVRKLKRELEKEI